MTVVMKPPVFPVVRAICEPIACNVLRVASFYVQGLANN